MDASTIIWLLAGGIVVFLLALIFAWVLCTAAKIGDREMQRQRDDH